MDNAIGRVTGILCIPYGYTVSAWCASALIVRRYGLLSALEVFLFAAGVWRASSYWPSSDGLVFDLEVPMRVPAIVVANACPLVAVLVVIGLPLGVLDRRVGFFAVSFFATAVYLISLAAMIRIAKVERRTSWTGAESARADEDGRRQLSA